MQKKKVKKKKKKIELIKSGKKPYIKIYKINSISQYGFWLVNDGLIEILKKEHGLLK